jgi:hypothetical protein
MDFGKGPQPWQDAAADAGTLIARILLTPPALDERVAVS